MGGSMKALFYVPTIIYLRYVLQAIDRMGLFPNTLWSSPSEKWKPNNFGSKICLAIFTFLELLQSAAFLVYIYTDKAVRSVVVLEALCWMYMSCTSYISFFTWNVFLDTKKIICFYQEWAFIEQQIIGSKSNLLAKF